MNKKKIEAANPHIPPLSPWTFLPFRLLNGFEIVRIFVFFIFFLSAQNELFTNLLKLLNGASTISHPIDYY